MATQTELAQAPTVVPIVAQTQEIEAPKVEAPAPTETAPEPAQEQPKEEAEPAASKPKVRRIIDEEGGTTTATVIYLNLPLFSQ